jgi:hypothetical protein
MNRLYWISCLLSLLQADVHVWNVLEVSQPMQCQLSAVVESNFDFVDENDEPLPMRFFVSDIFLFGLVLKEPLPSFGMIYSVACQDVCNSTKRSIVLVSALGPNQADANVIDYNGAHATFDVDRLPLQFRFY